MDKFNATFKLGRTDYDYVHIEPHPDYISIIETGVDEVLFSQYCGSYQGDVVSLVRRGDEYGILVFGYGSCSGCDWLEGICGYGNASQSTLDELKAMRDSLIGDGMWAKDRHGIQSKIDNLFEKNSWYCHDGELMGAIQKAKMMIPESAQHAV